MEGHLSTSSLPPPRSSDETPSASGRATPISGESDIRLGVDIGGTKVEAVVLRIRHDEPEVLSRVRHPTHRDRGYEHVLGVTVATIDDARKEAGLHRLPAIGVGMPGNVTYRRADGTASPVALVKNSNTTCLNGRPFRSDLETRLRTAIAFDNDANCFALAEAVFGAGRLRPASVVFGVIMGTGVGGGIALRRAGRGYSTWAGHHGIAGEWGHIALEPERGPSCYCGRRGCVERYLSGPAMEEAYAAKTGIPLTLPHIGDRALTGEDPAARAVLSDATAMFGRALAIVLNVLDPDIVVLGGGASHLPTWTEEGPAEVSKWLFNDALETPIVRHQLGDSAGVLGAALLAHGAFG